MPVSYQKAYYFLHRHLENYDMERAIQKWNKGYPEDPTTPTEIEGFLTELVNRLESGMGESAAIYGISQGQETMARSEVGLPPEPPAKIKVVTRRKKSKKSKR